MKNVGIVVIILLLMGARNYNVSPQWDTRDGKIVNATVCKNYKKGSLDYRACRNIAVKFFKKECKRGRGEIYCRAARTYRP